MLYAVHSGEMVLFLRPFGTQVLVFLYCHSLKHWHIQHEICLWTRWPHPNPSRERAKGSPPLHGNGLKIVSIISIHNLIATWRCKGVAKSVISSWDSMKRKEEHIFWVKFWNLCLKTHMVIFFFFLLWSSWGVIIVPIVLRETEVKGICHLGLLHAQQWDGRLLLGMFYLMQSKDVPFNYNNIQILILYFLFINCVWCRLMWSECCFPTI